MAGSGFPIEWCQCARDGMECCGISRIPKSLPAAGSREASAGRRVASPVLNQSTKRRRGKTGQQLGQEALAVRLIKTSDSSRGTFQPSEARKEGL